MHPIVSDPLGTRLKSKRCFRELRVTAGVAAIFLRAATLIVLAMCVTGTTDSNVVWSMRTRADVEAAYRLLVENHPAAVPALHDDTFLRELTEAHAIALDRASQVHDYAGYTYTLRAFAAAFHDDHIGSRPGPGTTPLPLRWAGMLTSLRSGAYIVAGTNDRVLSCDGVDIAKVAENRLGDFLGDWSTPAQQYRLAPYLLVDYDNPFAPPPHVCDIVRDGVTVPQRLEWRAIDRRELAARIQAAAPRGQAGFSVRRFGRDWWIGLQVLDGRAKPVLDEVVTNVKAIRMAPLVVVDVRGNGGGSSAWGDRLAEALWGETRVAALLQRESVGNHCDKLWRATPGSLKTVEYYATHAQDFGAAADPTEVQRLREAIASGQPFDRPLATCGIQDAPDLLAVTKSPMLPQSPLKGRVAILTDSACFSSCLMMLEEFLALGAIQVGQGTARVSRYMEVRDELLPSGLSYFSTLQAVSLSMPRETGPFIPAIPYEGDIADTAALEQWLAKAPLLSGPLP